MKKKLLITVLSAVVLIGLAVLVGFLINKYRPSAQTKEEKVTKQEPQPPAQDHILVKFKAQISNDKKNEIHKKTGGKVKDEIKQIGVQIVEIPKGKGIDPESFTETYKGNFKNEIEYAEVDHVVSAQLIPNDPWYQYGQPQLARIHAPEAWDITAGNPNVKIAVLDSGLAYVEATMIDTDGDGVPDTTIRGTKPLTDVQGRYILGWDFANNDNDPWDDNNHGTWVYGVVGAATNNGIGIASTSWQNPVLVIKIFPYSGYTSSGTIAQGIIYAADQEAKAANVSAGGPGDSQTMQDAINYAWDKGMVTICAAGNFGTNIPSYPASDDHAISVSAIDSYDVLYSYSSFGQYIDIAAPGSAYTVGRGDNLYGTVGGTSVAAPYVTGVFGLVASINPALTPQQMVDIVLANADDLGTSGWDQYYGWGRVNAYKAVLAAKNYIPTTGIISGKVSDSSTGLGLSGAMVTALQSGISKGQSTTSTDGSYSISSLSAGTYDVRAEKTNYQTQTQTGKSVTAGQTTTVNVALVSQVTTGNITGKVTSSSGTALSYATVSAYQSGSLIKSTTSLTDGTYTLSNLNPGTYDLTASLSGYQSQTRTGISVISGQTTSGINFSLTPSTQNYGSLTGVVTKSGTTQIVSGAKVIATLSTGTTYQVTTNSSGTYTFTNIPTGSYTLKATYKGGLSGTAANVQILANQITTVNLQIKKGR